MKTGSVKWFNSELGFGKIELDDGSGEVSVHHSQIVSQDGAYRTLFEGVSVSFETVPTKKGGYRAERVVINGG